MKNQALFSLKDKSKKSNCRLLLFSFGALSVKCIMSMFRVPIMSLFFYRLGGVLPHIAKELHKQHINEVIETALSQSGVQAKVGPALKIIKVNTYTCTVRETIVFFPLPSFQIELNS